MVVGGKEADVLFTPIKVGRLQLANRIVYAPLTRCRAFDNIPQPAAAEYYSQRAVKDSLMLTEATCISQQGQVTLYTFFQVLCSPLIVPCQPATLPAAHCWRDTHNAEQEAVCGRFRSKSQSPDCGKTFVCWTPPV